MRPVRSSIHPGVALRFFPLSTVRIRARIPSRSILTCSSGRPRTCNTFWLAPLIFLYRPPSFISWTPVPILSQRAFPVLPLRPSWISAELPPGPSQNFRRPFSVVVSLSFCLLAAGGYDVLIWNKRNIRAPFSFVREPFTPLVCTC